MRIFSGLIAVAMLGGCASLSYLGGTNNGAMQPQVITTKTDTWWVFDKVPESKIIVQRANMAAGIAANPTITAAAEAAEAALAQSGRTCKIKDGNLVVAPSWEFNYECSGPSAKKDT